jgi:hypothetical protein
VKRWKCLTLASIGGFLGFYLLADVALAQAGGSGASIMSSTVVSMLDMISNVLNHFVGGTTGNELTATGQSLTGVTANLIYHLITVLDQLAILLPVGNTVA